MKTPEEQSAWNRRSQKWCNFMSRGGLTPTIDAKQDTYMVSATLKSWTFTNSHNYYVRAEGLLPLELANQLHQHPVGKTDIRCNGHCMCPSPETQQIWYTPSGQTIHALKEEADFKRLFSDNKDFLWDSLVFTDDRESVGAPYITSYHIDSELGLYIFTQFLTAHELPNVKPLGHWLPVNQKEKE